MSDTTNPIRLELLGEMIRRLQADVRTIRDDVKTIRESQRRDLLQGIEMLTDRMATHEAVVQSRLDQMSEVLFAIADKLGVEYRR